MTDDRKLRSALRSLIASIATPQKGARDDPSGFIGTFTPPGQEGVEGAAQAYELTGAQYDALRKCRSLMVNDTRFEHLSRSEVEGSVMQLAGEIADSPNDYKSSDSQNARVSKFLNETAMDIQPFEVMWVIEGLDMGQETFEASGVTFMKLTDQRVAGWGYRHTAQFSAIQRDMINQPVAVVRVEAGSPKKAVERSSVAVDTALQILRVCAVSRESWPVWDEQLLQRRGTAYGVKLLQPESVTLSGWHLGHRSVSFPLEGENLQAANAFAQRLSQIYAAEFPAGLRGSLTRALMWIGSSISREQLDDKVSDLCTALEALLAEKSDRRKGEAIAIRAALLGIATGRPFRDPAALLEAYEMRSAVVHGSDLGICTEVEYRLLRTTAIRVVTQILDYWRRNKSIKKVSGLIRAIETPEGFELVQTLLKDHPEKGAGQLSDLIAEKLADTRP